MSLKLTPRRQTVRIRTLLHLAAAAAIMVVCTAPSLMAQRGGRGAAPQAPAGPAPKLADGKPDFSGHWTNPYTPNMAGARGANALDPATLMAFDWPHKGEPLTDARGQAKTYDLPY